MAGMRASYRATVTFPRPHCSHSKTESLDFSLLSPPALTREKALSGCCRKSLCYRHRGGGSRCWRWRVPITSGIHTAEDGGVSTALAP